VVIVQYYTTIHNLPAIAVYLIPQMVYKQITIYIFSKVNCRWHHLRPRADGIEEISSHVQSGLRFKYIVYSKRDRRIITLLYNICAKHFEPGFQKAGSNLKIVAYTYFNNILIFF